MPRPDFPRTVLQFQRQFGTDEACLTYLIASRWPGGFACPRCQWREAYWKAPRKLFECKACGYQTSVTAGTVMHRSKMPLPVWFWAAYLVTTHTPGMSALQFARQMDLRYETAFQMLHRLRAAMVKEGRDRLRGAVEVDETFIGGTRVGLGRIGRSTRFGSSIVVGAVEARGVAACGRLRLKVIPAATAAQLIPFVTGAVEPASEVMTDGWIGYWRLKNAGYRHRPKVARTADKPEEVLPRIHLVFSNLKTWLQGTHHGSVKKQHLQAYLNEFTFRFNRRRTPMAAFQTVLGLASQRLGPTYRGLYGVVQGSSEWHHPGPISGVVGS